MRLTLRLALVIALPVIHAAAQTASGTINVVAEDSTQAVVPDAAITVSNKATGLTRSGNPGPAASSSATFLPAGEYSISVQQGVQAFHDLVIHLQVDQNATVRVTLTPVMWWRPYR